MESKFNDPRKTFETDTQNENYPMEDIFEKHDTSFRICEVCVRVARVSIEVHLSETPECNECLEQKAQQALMSGRQHGSSSSSKKPKSEMLDLQKIEHRGTLSGHKAGVLTIIELNDGRLASSSADGVIKIWNIYSRECELAMSGHKANSIWGLTQCRSGRLVSASDNSTVRVWDIATCSCLQTYNNDSNAAHVVTELSDGRIAIPSGDSHIRIWNPMTLEVELLQGHEMRVWQVIQLKDGRLVSTSTDKTLRVWDLKTGNCEAILMGHREWARGVIELDDGRVASGSFDNTIKIWNLASGKCEKTITENHSCAYSFAQLSPTQLLTPFINDSIAVVNIETGEIEGIFGQHKDQVMGLAKLQGGGFASGSNDLTISIWY